MKKAAPIILFWFFLFFVAGEIIGLVWKIYARHKASIEHYEERKAITTK